MKILPRLAPNEEETAAERCSEKLVDLVVLLTTKVILDLVHVHLVVALLLFLLLLLLLFCNLKR